MEWQYLGDDDWVFGTKVRGVVRQCYAYIEYDKKPEEWRWIAYHFLDDNECRVGHAPTLCEAIEEAEEALKAYGIIE